MNIHALLKSQAVRRESLKVAITFVRNKEASACFS